jgi:hypothetical protein
MKFLLCNFDHRSVGIVTDYGLDGRGPMTFFTSPQHLYLLWDPPIIVNWYLVGPLSLGVHKRTILELYLHLFICPHGTMFN